MRRTALISLILLASCGKPPAPVPTASPAPAPVATPTPTVTPEAASPTPSPTPNPAPSPSPRFEKRVALAITASTWRDGERPYDVRSDVEGQLATAGVACAAEGAAADGALAVTYEETEGREYKSEDGERKLVGTRVSCQVRLHDSGEKLLLELEIDVDLGTTVFTQGNLHKEAVDQFRHDTVWNHAGRLVAAALGVRSAFPPLVARAWDQELGDHVRKLVKERGYAPADATERAHLAIADGEFEAVGKMGRDALPALRDYTQEADWARNVPGIVTAVLLIGPSGLEILHRLLKEAENNLYDVSEELFGALAKIDDGSALPILDRIAGLKAPEGEEEPPAPEETIAAARKTAAAIRARLAKKE